MKIFKSKTFNTILISIFFIPSFCFGIKGDFKLVEQWKYGDNIPTISVNSFVDKDGELIGLSYNYDQYPLATPKKLKTFAKYGEGPSDLFRIHCCTEYKGDIAIMELPQAGKMKVFTKKDGKYEWKATKWFKTNVNVQVTTQGIFLKGKWFFAGLGYFNTNEKVYLKSIIHTFAVKAYDDSGKILKELVLSDIEGQTHYINMLYFISKYEGKALFASENQLCIKVICPDELKVIKDVKLEVPKFYKPMPEEFYKKKDYKGDFSKFRKDLEYWWTSYSRINRMLVAGNHLVFQIRTCSDKLKRFALLFYNANTFKLERTVFTDDLLIGFRNERYYFFAGGDPLLDDEVEECTINIYSFK